MAFVVLMWLVGATFFFIQGVYIIRTGRVSWVFAKPEYQYSPRSVFVRLGYACFYLAISIAMLVILANQIEHIGVSPLKKWLDENFGMLFWCVFLAVGGILYLVQPSKMIRWTIRSNATLADNRSVIITVRLIGLGILAVALAMLAKL